MQDVDKNAETQIEASGSPTISFYLVLRRWGNLYPSQEFRCFCKSKKADPIDAETHQVLSIFDATKGSIQDLIETFFAESIVGVYPDDSYSFDVYIDRKSVFGCLTSTSLAADALLYMG